MKKLTLIGVAAAALLLSGCTTGPNNDELVNPSTAPTNAQNSGAVCGGLTTEALEQSFAVDLTGPRVERGDSDEGTLSWTHESCDWANDAADLEVDLDVAVASDFADGTVACPEPAGSGTSSPVEGIGTKAWWTADDGKDSEGTLRVCTADSLFDLEVDAPAGSYRTDELRDKAVEILRPLVVL